MLDKQLVFYPKVVNILHCILLLFRYQTSHYFEGLVLIGKLLGKKV